MIRSAEISDCGRYRWILVRDGLQQSTPGTSPPGAKTVLWTMLNPSTADGAVDDPTMMRVIAFSRRWGYERVEVVNLFAFRSPHPHTIPRDYGTAVGVLNNAITESALRRAGQVIAAWGGGSGVFGLMERRIAEIRAMAQAAKRPLMALGTTKAGSPKHPLARGIHRVPDDATPIPWPKFRPGAS